MPFGDNFETARQLAQYFASMLDTTTEQRYDDDLHPAVSAYSKLPLFKQYPMSRFGEPVNKYLYGGVKLQLPFNDVNQVERDPVRDAVYGYLISMGYPLYGPSFGDLQVSKGQPPVMGFGAKQPERELSWNPEFNP